MNCNEYVTVLKNDVLNHKLSLDQAAVYSYFKSYLHSAITTGTHLDKNGYFYLIRDAGGTIGRAALELEVFSVSKVKRLIVDLEKKGLLRSDLILGKNKKIYVTNQDEYINRANLQAKHQSNLLKRDPLLNLPQDENDASRKFRSEPSWKSRSEPSWKSRSEPSWKSRSEQPINKDSIKIELKECVRGGTLIFDFKEEEFNSAMRYIYDKWSLLKTPIKESYLEEHKKTVLSFIKEHKCSLEDVKSASDNYLEVFNSDNHYYSVNWNIGQFFKASRHSDSPARKFLPENFKIEEFENFKKSKNEVKKVNRQHKEEEIKNIEVKSLETRVDARGKPKPRFSLIG